MMQRDTLQQRISYFAMQRELSENPHGAPWFKTLAEWADASTPKLSSPGAKMKDGSLDETALMAGKNISRESRLSMNMQLLPLVELNAHFYYTPMQDAWTLITTNSGLVNGGLMPTHGNSCPDPKNAAGTVTLGLVGFTSDMRTTMCLLERRMGLPVDWSSVTEKRSKKRNDFDSNSLKNTAMENETSYNAETASSLLALEARELLFNTLAFEELRREGVKYGCIPPPSPPPPSCFSDEASPAVVLDDVGSGSEASLSDGCAPKQISAHDFRASEPRSLHREGEANVTSKMLMVVSDRGTSSTSLLKALEKNPCVFNIMEPFTNNQWFRSGRAAGTGTQQPSTFSEEGLLKSTAALLDLDETIEAAHEKRSKWKVHTPLPASLFAELSVDDFAAFHVRLANHICSFMPEALANRCDARCVVVGKVFPEYFGGMTEPVNDARMFNEKDLFASSVYGKDSYNLWSQALKRFGEMDAIEAVVLSRDEPDRQLSVWRQFNYNSSWFNCDVSRSTNVFAKKAEAQGFPVLEFDKMAQSDEDALSGVRTVLQLVDLTARNGSDYLSELAFDTEGDSGIDASCAGGGWLMGPGGSSEDVLTGNSTLSTQLCRTPRKACAVEEETLNAGIEAARGRYQNAHQNRDVRAFQEHDPVELAGFTRVFLPTRTIVGTFCESRR
jgi:hypothetical protein